MPAKMPALPSADPDTSIEDADIEDADIVLADRPVETTAHIIALASDQKRNIWRDARSETWPADVRAVVPADIDAATLGAVVAVVAGGLVVMPPRDVTDEIAGAETAAQNSGEKK